MRATWAEPRRRAFVLLALAVLALHAALLERFAAIGPDLDAPGPAPTLQVRALPAGPAAAPAPAVVEAPAAVPMPVAPRPQARPVPRGAAAAIVAPEPVAAAEAPPPVEVAASQAAPAAAAASAPAPDAGTAIAAPAEAPAGPELPTYRTRLPPAATLRYDLQRGRFGGSGELRWMPAGDRYELRLDASVVGIAVLTQVSTGGFDAAGLAPLRFTDQRARRPAQAANFDREAGRLTFSGPSFSLPLRTGVQDRLSWMIQLAAIVAADPQWAEPDARVVLQVVGARGDAGGWVFRSVGAEPLDTAAGRIDSVRFVREPRGPYDTGVEVWLDPARHHLPVRATIRNGGEGEGLELRLRDAVIGG